MVGAREDRQRGVAHRPLNRFDRLVVALSQVVANVAAPSAPVTKQGVHRFGSEADHDLNLRDARVAELLDRVLEQRPIDHRAEGRRQCLDARSVGGVGGEQDSSHE